MALSCRATVGVILIVILAGACRTGLPDRRSQSGALARPSPRPAGVPQPVVAWRWEAPRGASVGVPAADAQSVAVTTAHRWLVLFDAGGSPRWQTEHIGLREVAPMLTPELVLAATDDGVAAFDRATGVVRWRTLVGERVNTPVIVASHVIVTTWDGSVMALDLGSGSVVWRHPIPGGALGPAAGGGRGVAVVTWENHGRGVSGAATAGVVALDATTGAVRWERAVEPGGVSAPAVLPSLGVALLVAGDLAAHALDMATGAESWRIDTEGAGAPEVPPLALDDGTVVVAHRLGGFLVVDAGARATGHEPKWRATSDGAVVRGAITGPAPGGGAGAQARFALPLHDGRVLVAGPDRQHLLFPEAPAFGAALGPRGTLVVSTAGADLNVLVAYTGW